MLVATGAVTLARPVKPEKAEAPVSAQAISVTVAGRIMEIIRSLSLPEMPGT
jgi:hypothetical protein